VEGLLLAARAAGVTDKRVLDVIRDTPRAAYVPLHFADVADRDEPLPLPHRQVTTQPSLTALMIAGLSLRGGERVLEIGTGYGYQTALLARLAARVISLEIWSDVADQARRNLASQGLVNVAVVVGDGTQGYPPDAPWDAIIVSAAFPRVPPPLIAQLKVGGRLVQPIGPGGDEDVVLFERSVDGLRRVRVLSSARFVQLRGRHGMPLQ
jgi:protein-L-isoaspartate(D-aspartate) O-methyltransferase